MTSRAPSEPTEQVDERPRRRAWDWLPAPPVGLGVYFGSRVLVATLLAAPLSRAVAQVVGGHPRGDAVLWDPGGIMLLETVRLLEPVAEGIVWSGLAVGVAAAFALLAPLAALIASQGPVDEQGRAPERSGRQLLSRAAEHFGPFALLLGASWLLQSFVVSLVVLMGGSVLNSAAPEAFERDVASLGIIGAGLLLAWLVGLAHDAARVLVAQHDRGVLEASAEGSVLIWRQLGRAVLAAGSRGLAAAVLLLLGGWVGIRIGCQSTGQLIGTTAVHHAAVLAAVLLRASWLRWLSLRAAEWVRAPRLGFDAQDGAI